MYKPGMFPPVLPREMFEDPRRQAEISVYDQLRDQKEASFLETKTRGFGEAGINRIASSKSRTR